MNILLNARARNTFMNDAMNEFRRTVYEMRNDVTGSIVYNEFFESCYIKAKQVMKTYIDQKLAGLVKSNQKLVQLEKIIRATTLERAKSWYQEFFVFGDIHMRTMTYYMDNGELRKAERMNEEQDNMLKKRLPMVEETKTYKARRASIAQKLRSIPSFANYLQMIERDLKVYQQIMKDADEKEKEERSENGIEKENKETVAEGESSKLPEPVEHQKDDISVKPGTSSGPRLSQDDVVPLAVSNQPESPKPESRPRVANNPRTEMKLNGRRNNLKWLTAKVEASRREAELSRSAAQSLPVSK